LTTQQKEKLSSLLTDKQKRTFKKIFNPGKQQRYVRRIERVKYKLNNLGFIEKGLEELTSFTDANQPEGLRQLALQELSLWYANQGTSEAAEHALTYLKRVNISPKDKAKYRRILILTAECLDVTGETELAREMLLNLSKEQRHPDIYLALVNVTSSIKEKIELINHVYHLYDDTQISIDKTGITLYDGLYARRSSAVHEDKSNTVAQNKVSIIVPTYNAEDFISTAIRSLFNQSYQNIEIIAVDDHSTDNTLQVLNELSAEDPRLKVIQTEKNGGAYAARNTALNIITGDFVTINDADDWSHPNKIEVQVKHLMAHDAVVGNFSNQARLTNDLRFYRRGKLGQYIFANMSSFMFKREPVLTALGYWDTVRFGADGEFVQRVKKVFGEKAVVKLNTAPMSFQRQTETSLTGNSAFGFPGYFMGVRKEYADAHAYHRRVNPDKLYYDFPQIKRPFPAPEPMWPEREKKDKDKRRHFDVIIASEFRLLGGTNMSNIEEIKAQKDLGLKTGLVQMNRYDLNTVEDINPKVREQIDGCSVQFVCYGESVTCDVLILRHPPVLQEKQLYLPKIKANTVKVIINQPPQRDYGEDGYRLYDFKTAADRLAEYVEYEKEPIWFPIGPVIRQAIETYHEDALSYINMSEEDWVNIINLEDWKSAKLPPESKPIRIGRHSRDQYVKWPEDKHKLLTIYPDSPIYQVHVLGGIKSVKKILGNKPQHWTVYEFGEMTPKDFLKTIDFFVYYTHSDWVEAFGRVIFEAMAAGVLVILPKQYQVLFEEAAIYREYDEVKDTLDWYVENPDAYQAQIELAWAFVDTHFGYSKHKQRLAEHVEVLKNVGGN
jgi:glycosyltransferase involved in cell wall biosynthesis